MDIEEVILAMFIVAIAILVVLIIYDATQPPVVIDESKIGEYKDSYIETRTIPMEIIKEESMFEFFIFIPVSTGKSFILIPVPIYDNYNVFRSANGVYFAIDKDDDQPSLNKEIIIRGTVMKDANDKVLFCVKVGSWEYYK